MRYEGIRLGAINGGWVDVCRTSYSASKADVDAKCSEHAEECHGVVAWSQNGLHAEIRWRRD